MYINFQQNRANRSVITVHTNVFAKKIASSINLQQPIAIFKNRSFQTCIIVKRTCISISSKIGLVLIDITKETLVIMTVTTVHTNLFAKICNLHKFAICN